jgi:hypothetical protein
LSRRPVEVPAPALEPQETIEQQAKSRSAIVIAQDGIQKRIADLSTARLAAADRKTLDDARGFLAQSRRALETDDLQRAGLLARKASLLVSAVEQSH